jgi:hypothetical protein
MRFDPPVVRKRLEHERRQLEKYILLQRMLDALSRIAA